MVRAETQDNNVQWNGVRHSWTMRYPNWPAAGEALRIELRVFHFDITAASVRIWDGTEHVYPMAWFESTGTYEYWFVEIPGEFTATRSRFWYGFFVTDGSDTDYYNRSGMHSGSSPRSGEFFVDLTPNSNHPLGATVTEGGTVFRLWAPYATRVEVGGSWNGWQGRTELARSGDIWTGFVPGAGHGHEYRFRLNDSDSWWKPDPRGRAMTSSVGNSIIIDPSRFAWSEGDYRTPYYEEMVIYEMHVGTFAGNGDGVSNFPSKFNDITDHHIDHFTDLGVNAVELLPISEFAGDLNWGYSPVCQFAVEAAYGRPEDFARFVNECHRRGVAVLLDVKYNAGGPSDNWLAYYDSSSNATYYYPEDSPNRRGGGVIGDRYNFNRNEVRDYLIDSALLFMREYHVDGFRLDHTSLIKDLPAGGGEGWQFLREFADAVHAQNPKAILIAEQWPNDGYVTEPTSNGGAGCDSMWHEAFKNAGLAAFNTIKYPGGSADMGSLRYAFTHPAVEIGTNAVNYLESHDEAGCVDPSKDCNGLRLVARASGNVNDEYAIGRSKLGGGTVLFAPGIPMLFMGQEWMEYAVWSTIKEPFDHRPSWTRKAQQSGVFKFFSDAVKVRRLYQGLDSGQGANVHHVNDGADVMAMHRYIYGTGEDVIVVLNYSTTTYTNYRIGFPWDGEWYEILNSDASVYGGGGAGNAGSVFASWGNYDGLPASAAMTIPRMSVLAFSKVRKQWPGATTPTPVPTATPTPGVGGDSPSLLVY